MYLWLCVGSSMSVCPVCALIFESLDLETSFLYVDTYSEYLDQMPISRIKVNWSGSVWSDESEQETGYERKHMYINTCIRD